jgi:hypothetical protein
MARASTTAENFALGGLFAASQPTPSTTAWWVSLHTADPGTTGASEYAGVTRQQYSPGTPSGGSVSNTATMTFATSGASAVTHIGTFSAVTAGNYQIGAALASSVTAASITFAAGAAAFSAS